MKLFTEDNKEFTAFIGRAEQIAAEIAGCTRESDAAGVNKLIANFKIKTEDFYRENRKLNIGVVGQVKAGKSSFLNTLLFDGKEILPKASTPKTATLTKMEYSEKNIIQIEYYSPDEWEVLEDNAMVDLDDEIYTSAREIVDMVRRNGVDPYPYLEKGREEIKFAAYEDLISHLNEYVGEDGKYTPIVKAVTLYLNKEEFRGLSIVDTPGLNDPIASRTIRTKEFMEVCDVVFFLSQSGSFLDKSDWTLLSSQLPQKGVKKLVLIASKYDSGIRDVLRKQDDDDIFGEDENTADNIPKACKIIRKKLRKRAKSKVEEFVRDLEARGSSQELTDVIRQCAEPIMVSSLAYNMSGKSLAEYSGEEKNVYAALKQFSNDMESDLKLLGNFDEVKKLFDEVVSEKERILAAKAKSFIPNAIEELKNLLLGYLDKIKTRIQILETNDKEQLMAERKLMESQIGTIKSEIAKVFGEVNAKLEAEKVNGLGEIRKAEKDCLNVKERMGTKIERDSYQVSDTVLILPWTWGASHTEYYTYEKHYSYCIAADAIENVHRYGLDASNQVEKVFRETLQAKEIKRRLIRVVVDHFDLGSETYDASLFRIILEETIGGIEFPVIDIDLTDEVGEIAGKFGGELTSAQQKTELSVAISKALSQIYEKLSQKLEETVKKFKKEMSEVQKKIESSLLDGISKEFQDLISKCENKEKEIEGYKMYAGLLEKELKDL